MRQGSRVVSWEIVFTKQAQKDAKKIAGAGLKDQTLKLLDILKKDPYKNPPHYEKLVGDLSGAYSRRITIQHRLVYQMFDELTIIKIIKMWTHYE